MGTHDLGNNIRLIRLAFGETQEELGALIGVEKNTISHYEHGKREPSKDILKQIADHYMVSVEMLLNAEIPKIGKDAQNINNWCRHIDDIFPTICSDKAKDNPHFCKAYSAHRRIWDRIKEIDEDALKKIDNWTFEEDFDMMSEYEEAAESKESMCEAVANSISFIYALIFFLNTIEKSLNMRSVTDPEIKEFLDDPDSGFRKELNEFKDLLKGADMREFESECLIMLKKSERWYEVADYFLALRYICAVEDNDLSLATNAAISAIMMRSLTVVENRFATVYLSLIQSFLK